MSCESNSRLSLREMVLFALIGSIMFVSKLAMEFLPNVHLLGVFTIALTLVFRRKALWPIYICVLLNGVYAGFALWWWPYLYLWTVLWAAAMLLPRDTVEKKRALPCMLLCAAHGLLFGALYAPAQALLFGLDLKGTLAWIAAGLPYDLIHCAGNFALGSLILPLASVMMRAREQQEQF